MPARPKGRAGRDDRAGSEADLGYVLAVSDKRADAESLLAGMLKRRAQGYYPAFAISEMHLALGRTDAALEWLDRATDERHMGFYMPSADPLYDPVRSHPRFRKVMQRMNLDQHAP